ncbi:hypothetical protein FNJ87_10110 [Nonlabens mediterrranea]|uniref:STAS domain-containing protein n=1 Tax=Nonlabens mediterrranea TaxID=1419947 RepID=A0ABS0A785_9FLAO|nr:hypothetical protein [Nonlabens mediterrranea]
MSLTIKRTQGIYQLSGILNATTSNCLVNHINFLLDEEAEVNINIDGLKLIDQNGVAAFMTIMSYSLRPDKNIYISGNGYKDIYNEYRYRSIA